MSRTTRSTSRAYRDTPEVDISGAKAPSDTSSNGQLNDDLLALKALRLLLESRLIDQTEYARRLESFQRRLEKGRVAE